MDSVLQLSTANCQLLFLIQFESKNASLSANIQSIQMKQNALPIPLLITLASIILFLPFLGSVHLFDWDEVNFAEASREMLITHDYSIPQINFQPFWEKPPLFFWFQVISMKIFGVNEFASRFPNAVCGICTLLVLYKLGKKIMDQAFGMLWVLVYAGSLLPHFYFKSGIIDPWFNLFIFLAVYQFFKYTDFEEKEKQIRYSPRWPFLRTGCND